MQTQRRAGRVSLTSDQEALLSRITDLIKNEDQGAIKEPWVALIKSFRKPGRQWSESGINDLLWQAIARALRAAGITGVTSEKDLENRAKALERGVNTGDEPSEKRLTLVKISNAMSEMHRVAKETMENIR